MVLTSEGSLYMYVQQSSVFLKNCIRFVDFSVYSFGSHRDGKLGLGKSIKSDVFSPTFVQQQYFGSRITQLAAGCDHSLALTEENQLFGWGFGQHGALRPGDLESDLFEPTRIDMDGVDGEITSVYCGMDCSMVQVLA